MRINAKICSSYEPCATPKPSNFHRSTLRVTCRFRQYPSFSAKEKSTLVVLFSLRCMEGENIFAHMRKNPFALRALCDTDALNSHRSTLRVTCRLRQYPSFSAKEKSTLVVLFSLRCMEGENIFAHTRKNPFALRALNYTDALNFHRSTLRVTCRLRQYPSFSAIRE